ncbi:MAG TPA: TnsD family Tn7-like transposition protein, partial [Methylotenera sp.]|nr:TnsD family Tn7-like transposition protein [Methylotenera sp.]
SISPYDKLLSQDRLKHFLKLIRKPRGFQHTVTHLLLIQFLFGSWDLFCSTYEWESQFKLDFTPAPQLDNASVNNSFDEILYEIAIRYKSGESLRKLALRHNYDIGTLMRQLGKFNLATIKRRPKKVTREVIDFVLNLLSQGHSLKSISLETSLSKSSIDRICTSNPSIQQVWKQNKKDTLRAQKRADLTQCIVDNPLTTKSAIKASMPSTINWLTAHDIVWLKQNLKTVNTDRGHRTPQTSKPRINWMERDDECLKALQEIRNIKLESWERRKPQAFLRRLPTLSFKPRLSNLPKSKEWVTSALERLNESIG